MSAQRQSSPYDLCSFLFADGRQCCIPAVDDGFCKSHGSMERLRRTRVEQNLESELSRFFTGPDSHLDVRSALESVFKAYSANQISARRAATFGYLGQLILLAKQDAEHVSQRELRDIYRAWSASVSAAYGPDGKLRNAPPASSKPTTQPANPGAPSTRPPTHP